MAKNGINIINYKHILYVFDRVAVSGLCTLAN